MPNLRSATSTLIGPGNAASLFPTIPPAAIPGPIPDLNVASTTVIGAGNAASLFPEITPAPIPSPAAASPPPASPAPASNAPAAEGSTSPAGRVADAFARASGAPRLAAQVLGLIALALAFLLTVTRLSVRRRK